MVLFLYVYARELTTVKFCYQEIRIKENTTVFWCNKIREMMANFVLKEADVSIGGEGKIVEIDESISWVLRPAQLVFPFKLPY